MGSSCRSRGTGWAAGLEGLSGAPCRVVPCPDARGGQSRSASRPALAHQVPSSRPQFRHPQSSWASPTWPGVVPRGLPEAQWPRPVPPHHPPVSWARHPHTGPQCLIYKVGSRNLSPRGGGRAQQGTVSQALAFKGDLCGSSSDKVTLSKASSSSRMQLDSGWPPSQVGDRSSWGRTLGAAGWVIPLGQMGVSLTTVPRTWLITTSRASTGSHSLRASGTSRETKRPWRPGPCLRAAQHTAQRSLRRARWRPLRHMQPPPCEAVIVTSLHGQESGGQG